MLYEQKNTAIGREVQGICRQKDKGERRRINQDKEAFEERDARTPLTPYFSQGPPPVLRGSRQGKYTPSACYAARRNTARSSMVRSGVPWVVSMELNGW